MASRAGPRSFAPKQAVLSAVGLAVVLAAIGLAVFGFPRGWTDGFLVAGISLLFILMLWRGRDRGPERRAALAQAPASELQAAVDAPRRLVEARARAAERRAKGGTVKTKVKRG